jgi:hypothetical protein
MKYSPISICIKRTFFQLEIVEIKKVLFKTNEKKPPLGVDIDF